MKAAVINQYGATDAIEITSNHPAPKIEDQNVLVEVHSAGLNRIDSMIRAGYLQQMLPIQMPAVQAGDFSGKVIKVGDKVKDIKAGDEVYGQAGVLLGGTGSLAEIAAAPANNVAKKPAALSMTEAAALPLVGSSAIQALEEHMKLQPKQKVLIHGGAGGIGSVAIQIAKHLGAYVATTVSGNDAELARSLGADEVIDYKTEDFTAKIKDYDAVLVTAADALTPSYNVLKKGGILVALAGQVDEELAKSHGITAISQMTKASNEQLSRLAQLVDEGKVKPLIDKTFDFSETKDAYNYFEQKHPKGKVVVTLK